MENKPSDSQPAKIGVIIPAYRVERQIATVISSIPGWVDEIIVVNDASPDATGEKIRTISDPRLHVLTHTRNQGVGGAMLTGYDYALKQGLDIMVKVDGDGQMDLAYLSFLINPILHENADYTKGNRFLDSVALKKMPFLRKLGNLALTFMTKLASGYWNIFDPTNGYTAISAEKLRSLDPKLVSKDYFFETSMLCELRKVNAVVEDIPIPAIYQDEVSSLKIYREFFVFLVNLVARFFSRLYNRYFLYDFSAASFYITAGLVLGFFGGIWGIVKWVHSSQTGIEASTGTVLIAVLPIILAIQFLVQAVALDIADVPTRVHKIDANLSMQDLWEK
jgi:glycosyltransferase involved in cell wall biosynthesis